MPTTDIGQRVKNITGLTNNEVGDLTTAGINNENDLRFIEFVDLPNTIAIVRRRKLIQIKGYLSRGQQLDATSTIEAIQESNSPGVQLPPPVPVPIVHPFALDPTCGAPKIHTNPLPDFSGDPVDYETWERKAKAIIKQSVYKVFIDRTATNGDIVEEARNLELFNIFVSCEGESHALNVVDKVRDDNNNLECGHAAWVALKEWYLDDTQKETMIKHYEAKLDSHLLDNDTTATNFINNFEICVRKLTKLGEVWSDERKVREFKARVNDDDYSIETRIHEGNFAELVTKIRTRDQDLESQALKQSSDNKRNRRFKQSDETDKDTDSFVPGKPRKNKPGSSKGKKEKYIPFFPPFLYKSLDPTSQKNMVKWRKMFNSGETMGKKDLHQKEHDDDSNSDNEKGTPPKKKQKGGDKKNRRVTKQRTVGSVDDTVEIKLANSFEEYSNLQNIIEEQVIFSEDDSKSFDKSDHSVFDVSKCVSRLRALKNAGKTSVGMSGGRTRHQPYAVIDSRGGSRSYWRHRIYNPPFLE